MRVKDYVASETELNAELDRLYLESGKGKSFTGILELVSNEQTIITAIHNMKSNKGSKTAGIDKKVINNYLQMPYCYATKTKSRKRQKNDEIKQIK